MINEDINIGMKRLEAIRLLIDYVEQLDVDEDDRDDTWIPSVASLCNLKEMIEEEGERNGDT